MRRKSIRQVVADPQPDEYYVLKVETSEKLSRSKKHPTENLFWCPSCMKYLPKSAFYKSKDRKWKIQVCCKECIREYNKQNRTEILEWHRNYRIKQRHKIEELIGNLCVVCEGTENIRYHEIHGKKHRSDQRYILTHSKDFVPVCDGCHRTLHRYFNCREQFAILLKYLITGEML